MPKNGSRVVIPTSADALMELLDNIIEKETALGADALLKPAELQLMTEKRDEARAARKEFKALTKAAEEKTKATNLALGLAKTQTVNTPGTALFLITKHRDLALAHNKENPKALGAFGYTVDDSPKVKKEKKVG